MTRRRGPNPAVTSLGYCAVALALVSNVGGVASDQVYLHVETCAQCTTPAGGR